ncbi:anti-apoptotic protein NR13-like [Nelusetta ayraudi]|uniref:anti-apoptotic protein NR13-like n=1 Tax=Nelusetta ayraudi TaxID=303726 RepID=UPI003F6FD07E
MSNGLWKETVAITKDYLSLCCSSQRLAPRTPNRLAVGMRHLTERFEQRNQNVVYAMAQMLRPWLGQDPITHLRMVLAEMPRDGSLTWDQVVGIFTMVGMLAKQLQAQRSHQDRGEEEAEEEQSHDNRRLAVAIADFLADVQRDWLLKQDGWDGFCKFYLHSFYANNTLLVKTALYTTIGMGLACLTFLAGRKMFTYVLHVFLSLGNR